MQEKNEQGTEIRAVQCKMARAALSWGVRDIAVAADVSPDTIIRLERGDALRRRTLDAVQRAFEAAGVIFIAANGDDVGVRLRKAEQKDDAP